MRRRQVHLDRVDRTAILRAAAREGRPFRSRLRPADGPAPMGPAKGKAHRAVPFEDARRMVRDHGAYRHLLRPGAEPQGSARTPAQQGARHVHRGGRHPPARPRAKVQPDACTAGADGVGASCTSNDAQRLVSCALRLCTTDRRPLSFTWAAHGSIMTCEVVMVEEVSWTNFSSTSQRPSRVRYTVIAPWQT